MTKILMILITGLTVVFVATGSMAAGLEGVDIHGFISQGYFSGGENTFTNGSGGEEFNFNEVSLNFGQELTDELRIGIQFFARDFKETGDSDIMIDWAFSDYHFQDWLGLRFGQMKTPHGLYNEIRDIDMLRNPIFLPESIYQELSHDVYLNDNYLALQGINSRDLFLSLQGLGLYGFLDLNALGGFSYLVMYGTQNLDTNEPRDFDKIDDSLSNLLTGDSIDVDYKYAGNVIWDTPLDGLRFGFSLNNLKMTANSHFTENFPLPDVPLIPAGTPVTVEYKSLQHWVGSVEFNWENLILMAEFMQSNKEYEITLSDLPSARVKSNPYGWYVGGGYRFMDWFELGGYYSQSNGDNDDYYENPAEIPHPALPFPVPLPSTDIFVELEDIAVTARFDINEYWAIKLEAHNIDGLFYIPDSDETTNGAIAQKEIEEDWRLFVAKMTVAF